MLAFLALSACAPQNNSRSDTSSKPVVGKNSAAKSSKDSQKNSDTDDGDEGSGESSDSNLANGKSDSDEKSGEKVNSQKTKSADAAGSNSKGSGSKKSIRNGRSVDGQNQGKSSLLNDSEDSLSKSYRCSLHESKVSENGLAKTEKKSDVVQIHDLVSQQRNIIQTQSASLFVRRDSEETDKQDRLGLSLKDGNVEFNAKTYLGGRLYFEIRNDAKNSATTAGCRAENLSNFQLMVSRVRCVGQEKNKVGVFPFARDLVVDPSLPRSVFFLLPTQTRSKLEAQMVVKKDDRGISILKLSFLETENSINFTTMTDIQNGAIIHVANKDTGYDLQVSCTLLRN